VNRDSSVRLTVVALFALTFSAALTVSDAQAERPKIAAAGLCGVVTDLTGEPVEKATVTAMFGDSSTSEETDKGGNWNFGRGVGPHWVQVEGRGMQTFEPCANPIYVRLAPMNHKRGLVTLDASKGVHKEKKSK